MRRSRWHKFSGIPSRSRLKIILKKACEFYTGVFGFEPSYINRKTGWAEFNIGGVRFAIREHEPSGNGVNPLVSLQVKGIDKTVAKLKARGVTFPGSGEVKTDFYGKLIEFQDPDGNIINLFEPATRY